MKKITDYDRGYWIAVQNAASFDLQADRQAVKALIRELAGKSPHSASNNITVYEAMAADAVSYADALLEELEKKK